MQIANHEMSTINISDDDVREVLKIQRRARKKLRAKNPV